MLVGIVVAIIAGIPAWAALKGSDQPPPSPPTPASTRPAERPTERTTASSGGADRSCVLPDGQAVTCGTADSSMIVNAQPCEYAAVRSALGVDEQVNLDLSTRARGNVCLVRPGAQASAAGATTATLARLAGGRPDSSLVVCFTRPDLTQPVSCAQPHRYEAIGDWQPKPPELPAAACVEAARGYTSRAVNTPDEPLLVATVPGTANGQPVFRCVISSPDPLRHSVWRWGDQEL